MSGEHNNDARRAWQIAALAVAADGGKYESLAKRLGMTDSQINQARDYGSEIHRSWRRILQPLMMPPGTKSNETRLRFDPGSKLSQELRQSRLVKEIETALRSFDWHSQITISFVQGDGTAGWNRSKRTVSVHTDYIRRFINQGKKRE